MQAYAGHSGECAKTEGWSGKWYILNPLLLLLPLPLLPTHHTDKGPCFGCSSGQPTSAAVLTGSDFRRQGGHQGYSGETHDTVCIVITIPLTLLSQREAAPQILSPTTPNGQVHLPTVYMTV